LLRLSFELIILSFSNRVGLKRKELVAIIQSQPTKWPAQAFGKFNQQKTNMDKMKQALVSEDSEFTTTEAVERPVTPRLKNTIPPPALQTTRPSGIPQAPASSATGILFIQMRCDDVFIETLIQYIPMFPLTSVSSVWL
jgi:hypothetical protein